MDTPIIIIIAAIVLAVGLIIHGAIQFGKYKEEFMAECQQDHKKYECVAMWRAGNQKIVATPVYVPVGR